MNNSETDNQNSPKSKKEEYNSIPVYYCKHCGSLAIMNMPALFEDYCDKCGSTEIGKASIEAWLHLQETIFKPMEKEKHKHF